MNPSDNNQPEPDNKPITPINDTPENNTDQSFESSPSTENQPISSPLMTPPPSSTPPIEDAVVESNEPLPPQQLVSKPKKRTLPILLGILIFIIAAGIGFTVWSMTQPSTKAPQSNEMTTDKTDSTPAAIKVEEETTSLQQLETELNSLDDATYADDTLSDTTLYGNN